MQGRRAELAWRRTTMPKKKSEKKVKKDGKVQKTDKK